MQESDFRSKFIQILENKDGLIHSSIDALKLMVKTMDDYDGLSGHQKKDMLLRILNEITAGDDGILYTQDDLLPRKIHDGLFFMIEHNLVSPIIDLVCEVTPMRLSKRITCFVYRIASVFCCCWTRQKKPDVLLENVQ